MTLLFVDVETTGTDPAKDKIVEAAWWQCDERLVEQRACGLVGEVRPRWAYVNPGIPIPATASAVHHITDLDISEDAFTADELLTELLCVDDMEGLILVAHNSRFDAQFLGLADHRWIDTYRVALRLVPDAPGHGLQVLRYHVLRDSEHTIRRQTEGQHPHRASYDVICLAHLFAALSRMATLDQLLQWSSEPALLPALRFGKHAGQPIAEVPGSYWQWILSKGDDFDEDVRHTAKHCLEVSR